MARRARKRREGARPSTPPRPGAHRGSTNGSAEHASPPHHAVSPPAAVSPPHHAVSPPAEVSPPHHAVSPPAEVSPRETMARGYARAREKDEAARAALVPLAPGERPWPITVSAVLAALFAVANVVLVLAGWEVDGKRPVASGLIFAAVMFAAAVGMWYLKYWAVLGWEVLLGVTFVGAMLSLLRAGNAQGLILAIAVMLLTGPLFWLLIRQMARIQMPTRK